MRLRWKLFFIIVLLTTPISSLGFVYAQNYQTAVSSLYSHFEDSKNNKITSYDINIRRYFSSVNTDGHPLALAPYLERIGSIDLFYGIDKGRGGTIFNSEGPFYGAALTYRKPGFPLSLRVGFSKSDFDLDPPFDGNLTLDTYALDVGVFLKDGFLVNLEYDRIETEISGTGLIRRSFESKIYSVLAKYVRESGNSTALNIESSISLRQFDNPNDNGSNIIVGILGDYYFNERVSFGGGFEFDKGDDKDNEGKSAAINVNVFITPIFSMGMEFEKFFADNTEGENEKSFDVLLTARF